MSSLAPLIPGHPGGDFASVIIGALALGVVLIAVWRKLRGKPHRWGAPSERGRSSG